MASGELHYLTLLEAGRKIRDGEISSAELTAAMLARIGKLKPEDLDRSVPFFTGQPMPIRDILLGMIISHGIHHRGQLTLMCRLAGGQAPGLYGPNREEMAAMRAGARPA